MYVERESRFVADTTLTNKNKQSTHIDVRFVANGVRKTGDFTPFPSLHSVHV